MKYLAIVFIIVVLISGCASNAALNQERQRVNTLQKQYDSALELLERMRTEYQSDRQILIKYGFETEKLKSQSATLDSLSKSLNRLSESVRKQAAELGDGSLMAQDLSFAINRISTLQEEFADNNRLLLEMRKSFEAGQESLTRRLENIEKELGTKKVSSKASPSEPSKVESTSTPPKEKSTISHTSETKTASSEKAPPPQSKPEANKAISVSSEIPKAATVEEQKLYDNAKATYDKRQFERAINLFEEFLRAYPNQPLAVNAHYWIGEAHYAMGDYSSAFREFRTVSSNYASSPKAPDAIVKMSLCNSKMGNFSGARQELNRVRNSYPKYERMSIVNKLLSELPE